MDRLNLAIESTLFIEFPRINAGHRYRCKLLGYKKKYSIMITTPVEGSEALTLLDNDRCTIRYMDGQNACAFETAVQRVCKEPFSYLHLYYPDLIEHVQLRAAQRFPVELQATATEKNNKDAIKYKTTIVDLSPLGIGFSSHEKIGETSDLIELKVELPSNGETKALQINVMICNIQENISNKNSEDILYRYGAKFLTEDPAQQLKIAELIYQHVNIIRNS